MCKNGWIKLPYEMKNSWLWQDENYDKRGAWLDLLFSVCQEECKTIFKGNITILKPGQMITSMRKLSEKWGWSKDKTSRFLKMLEDDNLICRITDIKNTLITIKNFNVYQLTSNNTEENEEKDIKETDDVVKSIKDTEAEIVENIDVNNKPERKDVVTRINEYYEDEELNQAFIDYVEMRKKIRKPMTARAITLAKNKLAKLAAIPFSDDINKTQAIKILEQSTFNSWQGLFELKEEKQDSTDWKEV